MNYIKVIIENIQKKTLVSYKIRVVKQTLYQMTHPKENTKIIFIFGCQRSGTTILAKIISSSPLVHTYGEGDPPYFFPETGKMKLRLLPTQEIKEQIKQEKSAFILLKPLYESQNAKYLLNEYEGSRLIWIYRNFMDVIDSHIKYYKTSGNDYVRDFFLTECKSWKNEKISDYAKDLLSRFRHQPLNSASAFALLWLIRNELFFECNQSEKSLIIHYEKLVSQPASEIKKIFEFLSIPYRKILSSLVHQNAVAKKVSFELDKEILIECQSMYDRLQNSSS